MKKVITTGVFPVAGFGSRFLPVTKAGPKEMLPIVDKPLIQYVVEEAVAAGITRLIFVTSGSKRAIEDYFDCNYELEAHLKEKENWHALAAIKQIVPESVSIAYVRQPKPLGLGDAVLRAKSLVGDSPFAVLLADDIMELGVAACMQEMVEIFNQTQSSVLAVEEVPRYQVDQYGIVSADAGSLAWPRIVSIIEKPKPEETSSNLAVTGRYLLTSSIFEKLEQTEKGIGGEIQLTDAIAQLLQSESVFMCPIQGRRYDCGSKLGLIQATIDFSLKRPDIGSALREYLETLLQTTA